MITSQINNIRMNYEGTENSQIENIIFSCRVKIAFYATERVKNMDTRKKNVTRKIFHDNFNTLKWDKFGAR